jgi:hypothetical protein
MGIIGCFVEGFKKITNPITQLQKKDRNFVWMEQCEQAFNKIKQFLTRNIILKVLDMDRDFPVCIDTLKEGMGKVPMKNSRVIPNVILIYERNERNSRTNTIKQRHREKKHISSEQ